jgi:hypothetical protein
MDSIMDSYNRRLARHRREMAKAMRALEEAGMAGPPTEPPAPETEPSRRTVVPKHIAQQLDESPEKPFVEPGFSRQRLIDRFRPKKG